MAKIKIIADENETIEEAEKLLEKAMEFHSSGDAHDDESFDDPAMTDVLNDMENTHKRIYLEMMQEIFQVLDEEYTDGNF